MGSELREECGVFGVWGHPEASRLTYYGLFALQHRGQESAGMAVARDGIVLSHRGMGLVSEVFDRETVRELEAPAAVGHVRYSTTGSSLLVNAQPLVVRFRGGHLALAHNGNLVNAAEIRRELEDRGSIFQTTTDTEVFAHLVAVSGHEDIPTAVLESTSVVRGGYALLILTPRCLIGVRDPHGIRPLCLGRIDGAYVLSSETCGLDTVGAELVREVAPGEMVVISDAGIRTEKLPGVGPEALCIFEYIYFARPDSDLRGINVHAVRKRLGRILARRYPVEADVVIGVPDSSISAASGFAEEAGIPYEIGLVKNRYIGRTFIQPRQELRAFGVKIKLNAIRRVVEDRRVVLVDDSIVRGTTSRYIVSLLRQAGAREVHMRISSPPYRHPCFYGIDTSSSGELVARERDVEQIRAYIRADSLCYLAPEDLERAVYPEGRARRGFCTACFTGDYPVPVPGAENVKFALEACGEPATGGRS